MDTIDKTGWTVSRVYFERFRKFRLTHQRRAKETFRIYELTVAAWVRITGDPDLAEITDDMVVDFLAAFSHLQRSTANRYRRHLYAILNFAGPPGPGHKDAKGLIDRIPWVPPLDEPRKRTRAIDQDVFERICDAVVVATRPRPVEAIDPTPSAWWLAFLATLYNSGLRRTAALLLEDDDVEWAAGFATSPWDREKTHQDHVVPLGTATRFLFALRGRSPLLAWSGSKGWPGFKASLYRQWFKIQSAAGVRPPFYDLHDLRRTNATELAARGYTTLAQLMMGHRSFDVTASHYLDLRRVLAQVPNLIPQPKAFLADGEAFPKLSADSGAG